MRNQQRPGDGQRDRATEARPGTVSRQQWRDVAASGQRFYRPRFKVTLQDADAGFVPGYN